MSGALPCGRAISRWSNCKKASGLAASFAGLPGSKSKHAKPLPCTANVPSSGSTPPRSCAPQPFELAGLPKMLKPKLCAGPNQSGPLGALFRAMIELETRNGPGCAQTAPPELDAELFAKVTKFSTVTDGAETAPPCGAK